MMALFVDIVVVLLKTLTTVFDVISFPIFFFIQKPLKTVSQSEKPKARARDPTDPNSEWTRIESIPLENHFILECQTVPDLFSRAVQTYGDKKCFGSRALLSEEDERQSDGKVFKKVVLEEEYHWFSYKQIARRVSRVANGLHECGVRDNHNVVIFAETRVEWMVCAQALFSLDASVVTLYSTLGEEALVHGINETEAQLVVTASDLLEKLSPVLKRMSRIKTIVYMEGLKRAKLETLFSKQELQRIRFLSFSSLETMETKHFSPKGPKADSTAVLMYTSGSTGVPKAVMISHKNLLHAVKAFFTISHALSDKDVYCAYLPLAHVLELSAELFFFSLGLSVGFASPQTLTDNSSGLKRGVKGDTSLLKPTVLCAVPLILDRIRKAIEEQVQQKGQLSRAIFNFALDYKKAWTQRGFRTPMVDFLVCRKIRALLGGRLRLLAAGSAPLAPETHEFIRTCLNVELLQGYGLTETTASATLMDINDLSVGTVGAPLEGVKIKLIDWTEGNYRVTDRPNPRGEIVVGGDSITKGYYKNEELTRESYHEEGGVKWFFTGDIGEMTSKGCLRIIDRKKDLVKLQFGEYISLGKIEALLKGCPLVDNICVYGDSLQTFLVAIIVPNPKALSLISPQSKTLQEICRDPQINRRVTQEISLFGQRCGLHKTEIPSRVHLVADEWIPDSGLVTAALKLRRKNIQDFYQMEINKLYGKVFESKST